MIDFATARRLMVDGQVRTANVTEPRLLAAMLELPRERFFPEDKASLAYLDLDVVVSDPGRPVRRLLKPMVLAKLIQAADISAADRVLDVGCASGYSTALLAKLAHSVVGLEEDEILAGRATEALAGCGITNAKIVVGRLANGCPAEAPFDAIVLEGATEIVPTALAAQLKNRGRLVGVFGRGPAAKALLYRLTEGDFSGRPVFDAAAPLLPGYTKRQEFVF
jgi:protein-L-isoaspartate(D-aspartate) O-methyltransferase